MTDHYETLLADHYTWLFGGFEVKCAENKQFFISHDIKPKAIGRAIDLGCGSGFQSIPLAQIGFTVISIDLSSKLLAELVRNQGDLPISTINDDLNHFHRHCLEQVELVVCMGDTLTHLESKGRVMQLFADIFSQLEPGGRFVLTYRDLSFELKDLERFIPVNSDDNRIFTCFLEYGNETVKVHDLVYENENNEWRFKKSFYNKLRLPAEWVVEKLTENGFQITHSICDKGLTTITAAKGDQGT